MRAWLRVTFCILTTVCIVSGVPVYSLDPHKHPETVEQSMKQDQPKGYLAKPTVENAPGVLVLHAWWGLNEDIQELCDKLAQSGFVAFAPDLYDGAIAETREEAEAAAGSIFENVDKAKAVVAEAARFLSGHVDSSHRGLGVVGLSLGGFLALEISNAKPDLIPAVVVFYATGSTDFSESHASYLGHFAASDEFEPQSNVDGLEKMLRDAGCPVTFHQYAGTSHWFAEPSRSEAYNAEAASIAWDRTIQFLRQQLIRMD